MNEEGNAFSSELAWKVRELEESRIIPWIWSQTIAEW